MQGQAESSSPIQAAEPAPTARLEPAEKGLPKVQAYELPIASLIQVAEGSGLQWVNSDPEKIAQVQAAIAAEPKPVHVPRERPPAVVLDEGPLVLVETRKDLSNLKLPF
jgi:ribonuclease E